MSATRIGLALGLSLAAAATPAEAGRSAEEEALRARAYEVCRGSRYPHDTKIVINYRQGWFRCELPKEYDRPDDRSK
jgi:hypothetical protein